MKTDRIEDSYRLSSMQQAMLVHHRLNPSTEVYIEQLVGSLHEALNTQAFGSAWEYVLLRQPALRTGFRWEDLDEPQQDVHAYAALPFDYKDWRNLSEADQRSRLDDFLKTDRQRGFDLTQVPLTRVTLIRLGEADYKFVWAHHHIIADGRSQAIVLTEVLDVYDAYTQDQEPQLKTLQPYRTFIDALPQQNDSTAETFWRKLLSGFTAPTPIDVMPKVKAFHADDDRRGERSLRLSADATSMLKNAAAQHQLTLNTFVQGAWALLLSRYSGEDDVVFGAVRACRRSTSVATDSMVGLLMNTLPVRVRLPVEQSVDAWLKELREQHLAVRRYEQTPLAQVRSWSEVPRGTALFESVVVFDDLDLTSQIQSRNEHQSQREFRLVEVNYYPLALYANGGDQLALTISFDRKRFDDETIDRMLGHLRTLLEGMASNLAQSISAVPILTAEERHTITVDWNATAVEYDLNKFIPQLLEEQTTRTPEAIALSFEGKQLTYQTFNGKVNQLAHYLQKLGVGPEVLVGVFMERSFEMVLSLHGILKAGGAYVPLDPEYPPDRVAFMLADTQVPIILTQARLINRLPTTTAKVICLDTAWTTIAQESGKNPISNVSGENLAYVIYTSGSTGKPKGVMNHHRGITNRLLWMQSAFNLTETDRVLQKTPFSFDVSVWEFFWPLIVGAQLVITRPGGHKESDYLIDLIVNEQITTLHFVPSMLQVFLEDQSVERCRSLKRVICSGEALPIDLQRRFFTRLAARLYNLYGPTEAAVDVSCWECQRDSDRKFVPIGYPIANTQLYILDRAGQPRPIGITGELHIGGVQVARGYLNRPELTAEKFICDPFSPDVPARLYKTGDSARYWPDGSLEYVGRLDFQVKVRGFRIELGEIEILISRFPGVREAIVVAREDEPGNKRLIAYIVPQMNGTLNVNELREFLKRQLPEYMLPAAFVQLEALPLTSNGKVDRRHLPQPEIDRHADKIFAPPQKESEKIIAEIWRELLHVNDVGLDDNFFELGGHSLLIVQAHRRLCQQFIAQPSITDMFKYPTIRTLSQFLAAPISDDDRSLTQRSLNRAQARQQALANRQRGR